MKIGDSITITKDEFLRLAPLGLNLYRPNIGYCYYATQVPPMARGLRQAVQGYIYGYHIDDYRDHLNGYWDYFDGDHLFTIVALPRLAIYRRRP